MWFWPLLPEFSHVSGNSQPEYRGEHACEGADPKRENGYVQSLFINEKSHLLKDEIIDTIYHRLGDNSLKRLQQLLLELWSRNYHTLTVHLTGSSGQWSNVLVSARIGQPLGWGRQAGDILYGTRWKRLNYISICIISNQVWSSIICCV